MLHQIVHLLVAHLIVLFSFAVGLQTRPREIVQAAKMHPGLLAKALLVLFVGVPLLTIACAKLFLLPPRAAGILVVFGVCPAAPLVAWRMAKRHDHAGTTALTLVVIASLLAPVLIPGWLAIVDWVFRNYGAAFHAALGALFGVILTKTVLPIAVGALVGFVLPRIAKPLARACSGLGIVALVVLLAVILKPTFETMRHLTVPAAVAVLLMVLGSAALGELAALDDIDHRETIATVAMTGSPALALAVIHASYPDLAGIAGLVGTFILLRLLSSLPYRFFTARRRRHAGYPPHEGRSVPA